MNLSAVMIVCSPGSTRSVSPDEVWRVQMRPSRSSWGPGKTSGEGGVT
jgi:hypothetical protein